MEHLIFISQFQRFPWSKYKFAYIIVYVNFVDTYIVLCEIYLFCNYTLLACCVLLFCTVYNRYIQSTRYIFWSHRPLLCWGQAIGYQRGRR